MISTPYQAGKECPQRGSLWTNDGSRPAPPPGLILSFELTVFFLKSTLASVLRFKTPWNLCLPLAK
jgi:hypothetical protein